MEICITKKDVLWGYIAQFFNLATGLITLPLILKLLSADEVGFNYILISINSIVALFDLGFSGQFSRYLTYIFSGAQEIQKEGISENYRDTVNENLLASTIKTARRVYLIISSIASFFLLIFGTWYVFVVTEGFTLIDHAFFVWFVFCLSSFFNIYFLYFNAFLQGRGLIKEIKQAQVYSRVVQVVITFILLFTGYGLLSVVFANLIAPFVFRYLAYKHFYTPNIKSIIENKKVNNDKIKEVFSILWYNAKKMGIIGVLSSAIGYASTLVIGGYLSLAEVGSYGLLVQLTGIIAGVAVVHFNSIVPKLSSLMVLKNHCELKKNFGLAMFSFYLIMMAGALAMYLAVPVFRYFKFNTQLPSYLIVGLFYIYKFNEQNQSLFSQLFLIENDLRFFPCAVWTGIISFAALWISLYMGLGILGVVLSQSIPLYFYAAWKWPIESMKKYDIHVWKDLVLYPVTFFKNDI